MFDWLLKTPLWCIAGTYRSDNYSDHPSNNGQHNANNDQYQR